MQNGEKKRNTLDEHFPRIFREVSFMFIVFVCINLVTN
jgi:hypothetical protein